MSQANPFSRRQYTERFSRPTRAIVYEQPSDHLREGYNAAGIDQKRTTNQQRAIGFVMVTFQRSCHRVRGLFVRLAPQAARAACKQLELEVRRPA